MKSIMTVSQQGAPLLSHSLKPVGSVCIVANSVISNRQAPVATKAYLKQKLGLTLNEMESEALGVQPAVV